MWNYARSLPWLIAVALTACAAPTAWYKPGSDESMYERDHAGCSLVAQRTVQFPAPPPQTYTITNTWGVPIGTASASAADNWAHVSNIGMSIGERRVAFRRCMVSRGWRQVRD